MVREPNDTITATVSIDFRDGSSIIDADIPTNPLASEGFISFWVGTNSLRTFPLRDIYHYTFNFGNS